MCPRATHCLRPASTGQRRPGTHLVASCAAWPGCSSVAPLAPHDVSVLLVEVHGRQAALQRGDILFDHLDSVSLPRCFSTDLRVVLLKLQHISPLTLVRYVKLPLLIKKALLDLEHDAACRFAPHVASRTAEHWPATQVDAHASSGSPQPLLLHRQLLLTLVELAETSTIRRLGYHFHGRLVMDVDRHQTLQYVMRGRSNPGSCRRRVRIRPHSRRDPLLVESVRVARRYRSRPHTPTTGVLKRALVVIFHRTSRHLVRMVPCTACWDSPTPVSIATACGIELVGRSFSISIVR